MKDKDLRETLVRAKLIQMGESGTIVNWFPAMSDQHRWEMHNKLEALFNYLGLKAVKEPERFVIEKLDRK